LFGELSVGARLVDWLGIGERSYFIVMETTNALFIGVLITALCLFLKGW